MNTQTATAEVVGSSEELGHLFVGEAYHQWLTQPAADAMRCVDTRAAFEAGWSAAMAAERERLQMLRAFIADDAMACTFQSLGQYRVALLRDLSAQHRS